MDLPALPLAPWKETKITLHLWLQIVGKVRMALHPELNHWWHVPLYVSPRGLTTQAIPLADGTLLEIELDLVDHRVEAHRSGFPPVGFELHDGLSVATFYHRMFEGLEQLELRPRIVARPYDAARVQSDVPFAEDQRHASYDSDAVNRFWRALAWTDRVLTVLRGRFVGKSTPVHLFWHSLDLAHTRFSGRAAPLQSGTAVDREAYSHEVVSFGFWPGDESVPAPAFYSYTYPEPEGLRDAPLSPASSSWTEGGMAHLAYDDVRSSEDPEADALAFFESAYRAGASLAGWDVEGLAAPQARP